MRASPPPQHGTRAQRRKGGFRFKAGIRAQTLAIVVIPGIALLITGAAAAGVLMTQALNARSWSVELAKLPDAQISGVGAIQNERSLSMRAAAGDAQAAAQLKGARDHTNAIFQSMAALSKATLKVNPDATGKAAAGFAQLVSKLPMVRQQVDQHQITVAEVDSFYSSVDQIAISTLEGSSRTSSNPRVSASLISAADSFAAVDLQSRATALVAADMVGGRKMSTADRIKLTQLTGSYHQLLDLQVTRMSPEQRARYQTLTGGDSWRTVVQGEDRLAQQGTLPGRAAEWLAAGDQVGTGLSDVAALQFRQVAKLSHDDAESQLERSIAAGVGVLLLGIVAFLVAVRLANRLVRRLQVLRTKTIDLAENVLPALVQRVHDGEQIDIDAEISGLDGGSDEIGEVAHAFEIAERTAVAAAAAEAKTRNGVNKVFLDIAHRSQVLVHRQLKVLDTAEARQNDPEDLELLFMLDHLVTRARRNAENLVVLGGGQPGRKWREPVALEAVVRSAVSETEDLNRVSAVRLPDVRVVAGAVADLSHLLAELVENATAFSPPESPVAIRGNIVGNGLAIEIMDQGLGLSYEQRAVLNETLSNPPDFQAMALAEKRHLGLFVIGQLAKRHKITVSLHDSPYGGVTAIILVPKALITSDRDPAAHEPVRPPALVPQGVPEQFQIDGSPRDRPVRLPAPPAASGGRRALPRRERLANLAPELRPDVSRSEPAAPAPPPPLRDPRRARDAMSSFQQGTRRARSSERPGQ